MIVLWTEKLDFTGNGTITAVAKPVHLWGMLLGLDGSNDPSITIFDSASTNLLNKREIVPTNTYDASALGLNGFMAPQGIECREGITVQHVGSGVCEVTILFYDGR